MRTDNKLEALGATILFVGLFIFIALSSLGEGGRAILDWIGWIGLGLFTVIIVLANKT